MATDAIADYRRKSLATREAAQRVNELVHRIQEVAEQLQGWRRLNIPGISLPLDLLQSPSLSIQEPWPTLQQVAQAIETWHLRRHESNSAWDRIPEADREGLQPPWEST